MTHAWSNARHIKASFNKVRQFLVRSDDIEVILSDAFNKELSYGGIYSIYCDKTRYGMGKSQFAYFLLQKYLHQDTNAEYNYHTFSPSDAGFQQLKEEITELYLKSNNDIPAYFFIDELDLILEPNLTDSEKSKRIESLGNTIIGVTEKAYNKNSKFYVFLIMSKRIQEEIDIYSNDRLARRINPLIRVDVDLKQGDFDNFALKLFAVFWVSKYKELNKKISKRNEYRFKIYAGDLITHFSSNLKQLNLDINSSSIGDILGKMRKIFNSIFSGVDESNFNILGDRARVGNRIEEKIRKYLINKSKPLEFKEKKNSVRVTFNDEKIKIDDHKCDGYYEFWVGDNIIGKMLVEITTEQSFSNRKQRQIKSFTKQHGTLLIWAFPNEDTKEKEISKIKEKLEKAKIANELYYIFIPKTLAKYVLLLSDYEFIYLDEITTGHGIINNIKSYLQKEAIYQLKKWMIKQPIGGETDENDDDGEEDLDTFDMEKFQPRIEDFFGIFFDHLGKKRQHRTMKIKLQNDIKDLYDPLKRFNVILPKDNEIDNIYREMAEILKRNKLCSYNALTDRKFLSTTKFFNKNQAINSCVKILKSRIENQLGIN